MKSGNASGRRAVRLLAVPLLIVAVTVLLIEFDILPWRRAWVVPPLITIYIAAELFLWNIQKKKRG